MVFVQTERKGLRKPWSNVLNPLFHDTDIRGSSQLAASSKHRPNLLAWAFSTLKTLV